MGSERGGKRYQAKEEAIPEWRSMVSEHFKEGDAWD